VVDIPAITCGRAYRSPSWSHDIAHIWVMTSTEHASEQSLPAQDVGLVVDTIPTLACLLVGTAPLTSSISAGSTSAGRLVHLRSRQGTDRLI